MNEVSDILEEGVTGGQVATDVVTAHLNHEFKGPFAELEFKEWFNRDTWAQDDPEIVEAVKKTFLIPPPKEPYALSLSNAVKQNPSDGQVQAVEKYLRKLTPGFFIESGANDGELNSNTIWLEKELGWEGLLVEADPYVFSKLRKKNRKAWLANVCLSGYTYPKEVTFYRNPVSSEAGGLIYDPYYGAIVPVGAQSIPLYTLLLALNRTTVDFFSLDVEGNELQILKTIPFDKITFKILTIEHLFVEEGKRALWTFMKSKGYILYKTIKTKMTGDSIFVHPSVLKLLPS
ncbi:unnamed protein product [Allacma fusca]|uniref:Methyltransferase FkbM domain-containing protein n=1 Tax=Allacma fusca TaxID=39272 RepID=A0A8J2P9F8_9HEXA|nr:unnamed protein product [Allacma fusca]